MTTPARLKTIIAASRSSAMTRIDRWRRALMSVALCATLLLVCSAQAQDRALVREIDAQIEQGLVSDAEAALSAARGRLSGSQVQVLEARLAFARGEYAQAVALFDLALKAELIAPMLQAERDLVAATEEVVRGYTRHLSPQKRFEVFLPPGKDEVLLPYALDVLDRAYDAIGEELGHRPPTPIRVEIYPRTATLAKVSSLTEQEIRTSGTIALCKYNRLMITSPRALLQGYDWADTLVHEYVHYVIHHKAGGGVPIWMHEGMAKFLERRWRGPEAQQLHPSSEHLLQRRVASDDLITFAQMHPSMAKLPSQEDASLAFAEVYTVMEYLRGQLGAGAFAKVLERIGEGQAADVAFAGALNTTFPKFERAWRGYLKVRPYPPSPEGAMWDNKLRFKEGDEPATELSQLPSPQARDHFKLGQMFQARERFEAAVAQYHKAIALTKSPNPALQARLAQSLLALKRPQEALDALLVVRDTFPSHGGMWLSLGEASLAVGHVDEALEALTESVYINPFDPRVHMLLARAYERKGQIDLSQRATRFEALVR